jgi:phenylacetate-coenzyme A ligase PaaK-like adenylate-forming protein
VPREEFNAVIKETLGIRKVINYYGMVEQVGSVFFECDSGHFHAPFTSEVLVRCPNTLRVLPHGNEGLLQLMSIIPTSYPGNSLLTADLGTIHGEDDCSCGLKGKYFTVHGRKAAAEIRGCSDVL